jgi:hypothetical protein
VGRAAQVESEPRTTYDHDDYDHDDYDPHDHRPTDSPPATTARAPADE